MCARPTSRSGSGRRRRPSPTSTIAAILEAARADRRRRGTSRLRVPVRARRLRPGGHRGGTRLHRPARRRDGADGPQGRRPRHRGRGRRAGRPVRGAAPRTDLDDVAVGRSVFPLLVKAAAGGGGKGMRDRARAGGPARSGGRRPPGGAAAFGDDTLLVRAVRRARAARRGADPRRRRTAMSSTCFERDCSVQRRHQKVIEEAPATDDHRGGARAACTASAVALARQVGYVNAGTVEFLVAGDEAFFLEMNTRLQVEHPVTEMVTGLDLVRLQLAVAAGRAAAVRRRPTSRCTGHAIEARVYAEDPFNGFLPQAGRRRDRALAGAGPRRRRARVRAAGRYVATTRCWAR